MSCPGGRQRGWWKAERAISELYRLRPQEGNLLVRCSSSQPLIMNEISVCLSKSAGSDMPNQSLWEEKEDRVVTEWTVSPALSEDL